MRLFHFRFQRRPGSPISIILALNFLTALGLAVITPFLALYFESFVSIQMVGLILAGSYGVSILANIFGAKIIEQIHEQRSLTLALAGTTLTVFLIGFVGHVAAIVSFFTLYTFLLTIVWFNVDLYVKHYSDATNLSGNEGKAGVFGNLGWLIGPMLGGLVAARYGLPSVFIFSALFTLVALILFVEARPHDRELAPPKHDRFRHALKEYFSNSELRRLYVIYFGLSFIYSAWAFIPVSLTQLGASISTVGLVFGLSALPWVLFEYPIGKLADRRLGERRFIIAGLAIVTIMLFVLGATRSLWSFVAVLFIGITGTSLIERTHQSYFLKLVDESEVEKISIWRTATGLGYIAAPLLAALILSASSLGFYYTVVGFVSVLFLAAATGLKHRT